MAWTYCRAEVPTTEFGKGTHFVVIIRDTSDMEDYQESISDTLPLLLFDGPTGQSAGMPFLYKPDHDLISVVFAGIHKTERIKKSKRTKISKKSKKSIHDCGFRFSAAPQYFFRLAFKFKQPKAKKELGNLLDVIFNKQPKDKNSLSNLRNLLNAQFKSTCSFKASFFSSHLARANVIEYIQEQQPSTLAKVPGISNFFIIIVDNTIPSYDLKKFLEEKVQDVKLAFQSEQNLSENFYIKSPISWMFVVENDKSLVSNHEDDLNPKKKLRYRISKIVSIKYLEARFKEIQDKETKEQFASLSEEKEKIIESLKKDKSVSNESAHDGYNLGWILLSGAVLGVLMFIKILQIRLQQFRFKGSIPEK
jgi:hypothetical protein